MKRRRFQRIMELQRDISRDHQQAMIGRTVEVLVEGRAEETEHLLAGRHAQQAPEIDGLTYVNDGVAYPGEIVRLEITDASRLRPGRPGGGARRGPRPPAAPGGEAPAPKKKRGLTVLH